MALHPVMAQALAPFAPADSEVHAIAERNRNHVRMLAERATLPAPVDFDRINDAYAHGAAVAESLSGVGYIVEDRHLDSRVSFFYRRPLEWCAHCEGPLTRGFCAECEA